MDSLLDLLQNPWGIKKNALMLQLPYNQAHRESENLVMKSLYQTRIFHSLPRVTE